MYHLNAFLVGFLLGKDDPGDSHTGAAHPKNVAADVWKAARIDRPEPYIPSGKVAVLGVCLVWWNGKWRIGKNSPRPAVTRDGGEITRLKNINRTRRVPPPKRSYRCISSLK